MEKVLNPDILKRYRRHLEMWTHIPEEDFLRLVNIIEIKHFKKGDTILKKGQTCRHAYFILSGYMRKFKPGRDQEVNISFYFEDETASDFFSVRYEVPSEFTIVAMEDCEVCCVAKADSIPIIQDSKSINEMLFRFFQDLYFKEEENAHSFKLLSPAQRYQFLLAHKSQYFRRIPLNHLASYLGMSRATLTRIRKKLK